MRIEVVGAGSIGLLLAGRLALAGNEVKLVCRTDEQAEAVNRRGLILYEKDGRSSRSVRLTAIGPAANEERNRPDGDWPEWLFLTVKQKDVNDSLLAALQARMGSQTNVLCFQNGIGHIEKMAGTLPASSLYAAVTTEAARKRSACEVDHTGSGETRIGRPLSPAETEDGSGPPDSLRRLLNCLECAGFSAILSNNINSAIWSKLLINAAINPLTAVLRVRNGELLRAKEWTEALRLLLDEGRAIARANGIETAADLWEQLVSVCERTAANHSSMLQDVTAGRETELEWITGSLLRHAEKQGVAAPSHRMVYQLLKGLEQATGKPETEALS